MSSREVGWISSYVGAGRVVNPMSNEDIGKSRVARDVARLGRRVTRRLLIFAVAVVMAVSSVSCNYLYTREFHLANKFPPMRDMRRSVDNLPERFGPWIVQVYFWSVYDSNDGKKIKANEFTCGMAFRLPEDARAMQDVVTDTTTLFINDTSANVIRVDSITLDFGPMGGKETLAAPAGAHRFFGCGIVHIPESVDSLTLRFTARLESPKGVEIMRKEFAPRFHRWQYRWNAWLPLE